ncbi:hypothetical protein BDQ12DRAFT_151249 [Crucibulum laeve]|uniref:Uncharacterized protein n=1 Tax=Crucibulum laeve TaxID=68775 RepID=A0A5C3LYK6_9AGAR|nr:hypothetical protein BDQ12DRAFT_151249 [Crucibulum laeve]
MTSEALSDKCDNVTRTSTDDIELNLPANSLQLELLIHSLSSLHHMSKSTLDSDLYGDIYGDEDNEPESGLPMEHQQLSESNTSTTTTVHGDPSLYNEPVPRKASVDAHSSLPAKPAASASSALSYSAQVAKQFSAYQQTPSQERQQRKEKLNSPIQSIATYDGSSMPTVVDSVFGKKPSEMHDAGTSQSALFFRSLIL